MFCWETLGPVTLAHITYLSNVADHMNPFMEMVFPDDGSLFQKYYAPCHKVKTVQ